MFRHAGSIRWQIARNSVATLHKVKACHQRSRLPQNGKARQSISEKREISREPWRPAAIFGGFRAVSLHPFAPQSQCLGDDCLAGGTGKLF
jgi:hypothetical protein